ncbi:MAG: tRNA dimethylallyltransferase [Bacteroidia bacterium]|nr:MAG: tRNA dimethylallyltransferase [Bacteroidia bacterium]
MSDKYLIVIGGPTAVGKTDLAIQIAKYFNTVILSADSRQIYKELNIGVAKPSEEQLKEVKHYFISHISIHQDYTAYDYQKEVHELLPQLFQQHDVVIMVGGTGFYINSVLYGLNEIPQISNEVKNKVKELYEIRGIEGLQDVLMQKDLEYFSKVDKYNPVRLMRALEVIYETGQPFSDFLNDKLIKKPDYFKAIKIFLNINREELYKRIDNRVLKMMEDGLEDEASSLYPFRHLKALNTVGYKEWWHYFESKKVEKNSVIEQIQKNTRHYAKRQITWFKHQWEAEEVKVDNTNLLTQNNVLHQILDRLKQN